MSTELKQLQFYRACLPLSRRILNLVVRTIRAHRTATRSRWRKLEPAAQALLILVHLREGEPLTQLAAGFGVSVSTAWRYVRETIRLLAHQAPTLEQGLRRARRRGHAHVVVDGTLITGDRLAADRPFYSGKHRRHGMNVRVVAAPNRELLWVSHALLGSVHDTRAARIWRLAERITAAGLLALADQGYAGLAPQVVLCPFKGRGKPWWKKDADSAHARLRGPGERAIAQLKSWHVPPRVRCCPHRISETVRAVLVLQLREAG